MISVTVPESMNLAIFASGGGSNFQAIVDAIESDRLDAQVVLCLSNRETAGVLQRAERCGIARAVLAPEDYPTHDGYRKALEDVLIRHKVDFIALAGYLKMIPAWLIATYRNRIVNIHPALLPRFGGKGLYGMRVHRAVLDEGVPESGATVHLVDEAYDTGPIVLQRRVPVLSDDTPESLAARVLEIEHTLYPEALALFADGRIRVENHTVTIRQDIEMIEVKNLPQPEDRYPIRRALLSVFDKSGLVEFAEGLVKQGVELISTGGTAAALRGAGLPVRDVSELTGFPEILGGRVKTLHPLVHGGLLARKTDAEDLAELTELGIQTIDLVVVNLYPFSEAVSTGDVTDAVAIENIDIGGPTMIRAAAKNFFFTAVATSPDQYASLLQEMEAGATCLSMATRRRLATAAFRHTAAYDTAVHGYFAESNLSISVPLSSTLRYGENPHQNASLYGHPERFIKKLHGKDLSFNNLLDLSAALALIDEFREAEPTCAILKHTNPCGVATADSLSTAYHHAFATDRQSPFGGIVIVNRSLDLETARAINETFTEIIIAPAFDDDVLDFLKQKKNRRLILHTGRAGNDAAPDVRSVIGGFLVQDRDPALPETDIFRDRCTVATRRAPTEDEWQDLDFAWRVVKHVKSNAIVYAKEHRTLGIGAGQMSRIDSSEVAVMKGNKSGLDFSGCVVASDAFFPFADGLLEAAKHGATAAIQPCGSMRDQEVIDAANENNMAMVCTGFRHFRH